MPHVCPLQQSPSLWQPCPVAAHPHVPSAHVPLQQSSGELQLWPSWEPEAPPHVLSQVPQLAPPQQSLSVVQLPPEPEQGLAQAPLVQTRAPQQSLSLVQVSPVPRHPQVPLPLHTLGAQQSLLLVHAVPDPAQPHVLVLVSQLSAPQQSRLPVQPCPLVAQPHVPFTQSAEQHSDALEQEVPSELQPPPAPPSPLPPVPPSTHVLLEGSHTAAPQQSSEDMQSPPTPAQAGWQVPSAQLPEQQSPLVLQQSSSYWQSGSSVEQEPLSLPVPPSCPPLPLPLPLPPPLLPLLVPPSWPPPVLVPHLPEVQESEQQLLYDEHELPSALHIVVPQTPFLQSLLQHPLLPVHVLPSGAQVGVGAAQVPEVQVLLQHSLSFVQLAPSFEHAADWQVPDTQSLLQQSVLVVQLPPRLAHMGCAQVPLVQVPLQQSLEPWHALPDDMQVGAPHTPALQVELQQSLASAQACPALRQTSCAQMPEEQDPLQQSEYAVHAAPPARHLPAGTDVFEPLLLAPSPAPSTIEPPESVANPAAPLPFEAHPWPVSATKGTASRSVMTAHARPKKRTLGMAASPQGPTTVYRP